jgi:DNA-binding CsgD family transcriptional regulator
MHSLAYLSALLTGLGELRQGMTLAEECLTLATAAGQVSQRAGALWPVAVAAAWLGDEERGRAAAGEGLALAAGSGHMLYAIGCQAALGLIELSSGRVAEAVDVLDAALTQARRSGIEALGRVSVLPDLIEAVAHTGDVARAGALAKELDARARLLNAPWALAVANRCHGLVAAAAGDTDAAMAVLKRALAEHDRQPRAPERARTELVLGAVVRRTGLKRAARELLERAASTFEAIGARSWASRARHELSRIGGRAAPAAGELSATEAAIAELVRAGQTNREIAAALHLSPRTVEWNLSRTYRKLGVRSRTELVAWLSRAP